MAFQLAYSVFIVKYRVTRQPGAYVSDPGHALGQRPQAQALAARPSGSG
jgi:hypothetical protein